MHPTDPGTRSDAPYTLAEWRVRPGQEAAFVAAWEGLARVFAALPAAPLWGTLLRSETEPQLFYSFGPWQRPEHIAAMRADPAAQAAMAAIRDLCESATPGGYRLIRHVEVGRNA